MTRMLRNIISFGKIAYSSKRKINEVEIDIRLCEKEEGEVLSISANVGGDLQIRGQVAIPANTTAALSRYSPVT